MSEIPATVGRQRWIEFLLIFAVFFVEGGAPVPHVNETHYLTKAKHYWDASYCPGDAFLDSADAHTAFYWSVGWLTRLVSLPAAAWIGRLAAWLWLAFAWQRLSQSLSTRAWVSVLGAALFVALISRGNFAGEWVVGGVEAKCFAYGFVFLGLAALARGRWATIWIWFGAAAAFHVLVGGWAVLAAAGVCIAEKGLRWALAPRVWAGVAIGGLLALIGLLPALALTRDIPTDTADEAARIYVFERLPHHLAPLELKPAELMNRLLRFGLMSGVFVGLWAWFARKDAKPQAAEPRAVLRILEFAGIAVILSGVGLTLEWLLIGRPDVAAKVLRYYWFRQADVAVPLAIAAAAMALATTPRNRFSATLVVFAVTFAGWHLIVESATRWQDRTPPAARKLTDFNAWRDACRWVGDNTPSDALFLIPWEGQSFKWYAQRADVVNRKDIPQDAVGVVEWLARRDAVFPKEESLRRGGRWTLAKRGRIWIIERTSEFGATHVIAAVGPHLRLPLLYKNAAYAVYRIP